MRFGFFSDFHQSEPAILFAGSKQALKRFADLLRSIGPAEQVQLNDVELFEPIRDANVTLAVTPTPRGMQIEAKGNTAVFKWDITSEDARNFSRLVDAVADSDVPGHQYLDTNGLDEVHVIVSKDEYPPEFFG